MSVPLNVLLVEDSDDDARLLLMELKRGGWDVKHHRVDTAAALSEALARQPWDLIVADYSMPQFTGVAALEMARRHKEDVPFILVSGTVGEEVAVSAMRAGANDYLFKGNLRRLVPVVQRELRDAQSRRDAQRTENELQKRDLQLADAQRLAHLGTWYLDLSAKTAIWSDETYRIFGESLQQPAKLFETFFEKLHWEDRDFLNGALNSPMATRFEQDCRITGPDGAERYVYFRGDIVRDASNKPIEAAGMIQDITQRKLAEQELRKAHDELKTAKNLAEAANKAKDEFLAVLSHELRTPLTPVLLLVSLLEQNDKLPQNVLDDLQTIRRNVELEARLIDDLLDLTRITRGKMQLRLETTDVHQLIRNAFGICFFDRTQDVTLSLEAQKHHVRADPARLQQVFWNLLNNANKFTPSGKKIEIRTSNAPSGGIRIEVSDGGVGIDPDVMPRIFMAFEQGDNSLTRQFGGLGLGLTITKALLDAQGGTIQASSGGRGKGATFLVEMPTVAAALAKPIRKPPQLAQTIQDALQILLVEDHAATMALMTQLLKSLGHEVKTAGCVKDALAAAELDQFDLVISDLGLPDGSGHDVMRALKARYSIKGIAVSGFGMDEDVNKSMEAGFFKHLIKPIDAEKLQIAIQQAAM